MNAGPKDERAGACGASPFRTRVNQQPNFASEPSVSKALATLRQELALHGYGLDESVDGGHFVLRWNVSPQQPDIRAVRELLMRIGGAL